MKPQQLWLPENNELASILVHDSKLMCIQTTLTELRGMDVFKKTDKKPRGNLVGVGLEEVGREVGGRYDFKKSILTCMKLSKKTLV